MYFRYLIFHELYSYIWFALLFGHSIHCLFLFYIWSSFRNMYFNLYMNCNSHLHRVKIKSSKWGTAISPRYEQNRWDFDSPTFSRLQTRSRLPPAVAAASTLHEFIHSKYKTIHELDPTVVCRRANRRGEMARELHGSPCLRGAHSWHNLLPRRHWACITTKKFRYAAAGNSVPQRGYNNFSAVRFGKYKIAVPRDRASLINRVGRDGRRSSVGK